MEQKAMVELAKRELRKHGFNIPVQLSPSKRFFGALGYMRGIGPVKIKLSKWLAVEPDEAILDTIRHEIAHIYAVNDGCYDHGPLWESYAIKLGARPESVSMRQVYVPAKYEVRCKCCTGLAIRAERLTKALKLKVERCYCSHCGYEKGTLYLIKNH